MVCPIGHLLCSRMDRGKDFRVIARRSEEWWSAMVAVAQAAIQFVHLEGRDNVTGGRSPGKEAGLVPNVSSTTSRVCSMLGLGRLATLI